MTDLERASIYFFKAILKTGHGILGHHNFVFTINATVGTSPEDAERAKIVGLRIQDALNIAKAEIGSLTIEGMTVK